MRIARMFLWESIVLGVLGATASVVVVAIAAAVVNSANIPLPLAVQLSLLPDLFELRALPSALGGAIALITVVTGAHALTARGFRVRV